MVVYSRMIQGFNQVGLIGPSWSPSFSWALGRSTPTTRAWSQGRASTGRTWGLKYEDSNSTALPALGNSHRQSPSHANVQLPLVSCPDLSWSHVTLSPSVQGGTILSNNHLGECLVEEVNALGFRLGTHPGFSLLLPRSCHSLKRMKTLLSWVGLPGKHYSESKSEKLKVNMEWALVNDTGMKPMLTKGIEMGNKTGKQLKSLWMTINWKPGLLWVRAGS